MASGTFTLYGKNKNNLNPVAVAAATVKVALITSTYTPNITATGHSLYSDISANEIAGVNGYTTGGATVSGLTVAATAGNDGFKITSSNVTWTASGGSIAAWRYAVMYVSGTLWTLTSPLIGYFVGDSTPADIPATSGTLTITANALGWWDVV